MKHNNVPRTALDIKSSTAPQLQDEASLPTRSSTTGNSLPTVIVPYCDGVDDRRLMIYVQLLSGLQKEDLHVDVSEDGTEVLYSIRWVKAILDPGSLLSKYVNYNGLPEYDQSHTVVASFRAATKILRGTGSNQDVRSDYRITLPFKCESQMISPPCFNRKPLELLKVDNALMMCIHLREVRTAYNKVNVTEVDFVDLDYETPNKKMKTIEPEW